MRSILECKRDEDGYYWILGRADDCINVSGHLLSTAEIESALVEHVAVSEAAVVNIRPHHISFTLQGSCRKSNSFSTKRTQKKHSGKKEQLIDLKCQSHGDNFTVTILITPCLN